MRQHDHETIPHFNRRPDQLYGLQPRSDIEDRIVIKGFGREEGRIMEFNK